MTRLSLRERRLVAVALLMAVVALLLYGVVLPIVDGFQARADARTALLDGYARDERAVLQIASARRAAEAQRRDAARFRIAGGNATVAADRLKERVAAAVTASGGDLRSVEDIAAATGVVRVRADARLTTAQLAAMAAAIQRSEPLLVVETLTVTADQALQSGRAAPMDVRLEVSGLLAAASPR